MERANSLMGSNFFFVYQRSCLRVLEILMGASDAFHSVWMMKRKDVQSL